MPTADTDAPSIAFAGGGNMAASLVGGLIGGGWPPERIHIGEPDPQRRAELGASFAARVHAGNREAAADARVLVLAVKPQVLQEVCRDLADLVQAHHPLVISVAAGVREPDLRRWLGGEAAVVRAMPNTPALLACGATGLYANPAVSEAQRDLAESVLRAVGVTRWMRTEAEMDLVTAVSGSGPAYFFLFMEALSEAAEAEGLGREDARLLVLETAFGAAKMALESPEGPASLRRRVTSPGGTTERALAVFEERGLRGIVRTAVQAARHRAGELADDLGSDP
jgi:pyrroline-5-carboxylate reductase